ncbi:MAG: rhomboid family intramembrane serine protease [Desulfobacteraceae bacterium]|nr:MAG: rhomboid family intramembrane serine protease [Desulfobacteraceae bacterium]
MIPIRDDNPARSIPLVNAFLIVANAAAFICPLFWMTGDPEAFYTGFGFVPHDFFYSGNSGWLSSSIPLFTSMFLHGGWVHLLGNMLYLWIFGDNVEDRLGHGRYLFFYICCGIVGTLVHGFIHAGSKVPTIGASGAIAGVLGAYLYLFPRARIRTLLVFLFFFRIVRIPAILLLRRCLHKEFSEPTSTHDWARAIRE